MEKNMYSSAYNTLYINIYARTVYKMKDDSSRAYIGTIHGSFDPMYSRASRLIRAALHVYGANNL
jgi:hypothetical protein